MSNFIVSDIATPLTNGSVTGNRSSSGDGNDV